MASVRESVVAREVDVEAWGTDHLWDATCPRERCDFSTSGHRTRKDAETRLRQHTEEHDGGPIYDKLGNLQPYVADGEVTGDADRDQ